MTCKASVDLTIPGTAIGVREALTFGLNAALGPLPQAERDTAQTVLAEVLNNIVEHAYAERQGDIVLELHVDPTGLVCHVTDHGAPMPDECLPSGRPPCPQDLPEGGYGWFLIRSLARDLTYRRVDGQNQLSFRIAREG